MLNSTVYPSTYVEDLSLIYLKVKRILFPIFEIPIWDPFIFVYFRLTSRSIRERNYLNQSQCWWYELYFVYHESLFSYWESILGIENVCITCAFLFFNYINSPGIMLGLKGHSITHWMGTLQCWWVVINCSVEYVCW